MITQDKKGYYSPNRPRQRRRVDELKKKKKTPTTCASKKAEKRSQERGRIHLFRGCCYSSYNQNNGNKKTIRWRARTWRARRKKREAEKQRLRAKVVCFDGRGIEGSEGLCVLYGNGRAKLERTEGAARGGKTSGRQRRGQPEDSTFGNGNPS